MKNRVYNSTFGKIMRTLGFLLILFSSVVIAVEFILLYGGLLGVDVVSSLVPVATQVNDILVQLPAVLFEYITVMFFVGFIFLIWAIRKGIIIRVVLTVGLLFMMVYTMLNFSSGITPVLLDIPTWSVDLLLQVDPLVQQLLDISKYILFGAVVGVPLLLWYVFANKKPGRFSIFILRLGAIALFLAVLMISVATEFINDMLTNDLYVMIQSILYTAGFGLFAAGSIFGILGFAKK